MGYRNPREIVWKRPVEDYVLKISSSNWNQEEEGHVWSTTVDSMIGVFGAQLEGTTGWERQQVIRHIHHSMVPTGAMAKAAVLRALGLPLPKMRTELPNAKEGANGAGGTGTGRH